MADFRSFWHGEFSPYQTLAMKSFIDYGHSYALYCYETLPVPAGVQLRDANEIIPASRIFYYQTGSGRGSISGFSNLFRYRLLHDHGGWWVDADVVCLTDQVFEPEIFLGREEAHAVGSAILRFPPRHPFMRELYERSEAAGPNVSWGQTGPKLITRTLQASGLEKHVISTERSYPLSARDALHLLIPSEADRLRQVVRDASFLHLWNEIFRRAVVLKWIAPPPASFLAELFRRHQVPMSAEHVYKTEEVERLNANFQAALNWNAARYAAKAAFPLPV